MAYRMETQMVLADFIKNKLTNRGKFQYTYYSPMEAADMILHFLDVLDCLKLGERIDKVEGNGQSSG